MIDLGKVCAECQDDASCNLPWRRIDVDALAASLGAGQRTPRWDQSAEPFGDGWSWTSFCFEAAKERTFVPRRTRGQTTSQPSIGASVRSFLRQCASTVSPWFGPPRNGRRKWGANQQNPERSEVMTTVDADFTEDLRQHFLFELRAFGYTPDDDWTSDRAGMAYFRARRRLVRQRPRRVHLSQEVQAQADTVLELVGTVTAEVERGDDLNLRLSREIPLPEVNDLLLNDWAIHHLHLGSRRETGRKGWPRIQGTRNLLFACFGDDDAWFIDVRPHGAWIDIELLETIRLNWPDLMQPHLMRGITQGRAPVTPGQRANLRRVHAQAPVRLGDGLFYSGPGGGMVSSGDAIRDRVACDRVHSGAEATERVIRAAADDIRAALVGAQCGAGNGLSIALRFRDGAPVYVETNTGAELRIPAIKPCEREFAWLRP